MGILFERVLDSVVGGGDDGGLQQLRRVDLYTFTAKVAPILFPRLIHLTDILPSHCGVTNQRQG